MMKTPWLELYCATPASLELARWTIHYNGCTGAPEPGRVVAFGSELQIGLLFWGIMLATAIALGPEL